MPAAHPVTIINLLAARTEVRIDLLTPFYGLANVAIRLLSAPYFTYSIQSVFYHGTSNHNCADATGLLSP